MSGAGEKPGALDYGLLLLLAAMWGGSFMLIKVAVVDYPPATQVSIRLAIAAAILFAVQFAVGERLMLNARVIILVTLVGLTGSALPFTLIAWGEEHVDAGLAAILMGIMPITTLILAHFFTADEPLNRRKLVGAVVGLSGLVILVGPAVLNRLGDDGVRQLAILAAAVSYGVTTILTKWLLDQPRRALGAAILFAGAVLITPVAFVLEDPMAITPGWSSTTAVILMAVLATAAAQLLVLELLDRQGAGFFGQINLLVPLFGVLWAFAILGERPSISAAAALTVILFGVAIARSGTQRQVSPSLVHKPTGTQS